MATTTMNGNDRTLSRSYCASYWFGFSYLPPASLVGREAVMR